MAGYGITRFRRGTNPKLNTQDPREVSPPAPVPRQPRPSIRRGSLGNIVVMTLAGGLVATLALPAYAFTPGKGEIRYGATAATELARSGAQAVEVSTLAATTSVSRDGFTATTVEELASRARARAAATAARAAEARRKEVARQMTSYAASYTGPSAKQYLAAPAHPNVSLSSVYNVAAQYQGVPYVYGGSTPAGFDCSGLVMYVYAQFGVSLPHSSAGQAAAGTRVATSSARPGDLVVMPGHIGFYAGNGNILHAPYSGTRVRVQPIWTSNYYIVRIGT
ncbi:Cell wall-associated hydrolase, NlpC family [Cryobacterium psychrotolerans]|uniref:Cell wall-associated hydrolase, NlpC family n=2 Tax=Cryobacterium psychrotolerans TaxID=386301 RepID=A0A1G9ADA8_9MICO|nr:Cell wall-associated hydrolase, NlpC family [Cryobacterium psychrotolerans]